MKKLIAIGMYIGFVLLPGCKKKEIGTECRGTPSGVIECNKKYDPVCGCDGVTYGNSCAAQLAGVKSWKAGACK